MGNLWSFKPKPNKVKPCICKLNFILAFVDESTPQICSFKTFLNNCLKYIAQKNVISLKIFVFIYSIMVKIFSNFGSLFQRAKKITLDILLNTSPKNYSLFLIQFLSLYRVKKIFFKYINVNGVWLAKNKINTISF